MVYRDPKMPHGITNISLEFIGKHLDLLGAVREVRIDCIEELGLETNVIGTKCTLVTDGFSVGYYGEGPTGLLGILTMFNLHMPKQPSDIDLIPGESYSWFALRRLSQEKKQMLKSNLKTRTEIRRREADKRRKEYHK